MRRYANRGPAVERDRFGAPLYIFTANEDVACDSCRRLIPAGEEFTRSEWGQRSERFSRWPVCAQCRPYSASAERAALEEKEQRS